MRQWWAKLRRSLAGRRELERELREELEAHLEFEIDENLSHGMAPERARSAARRAFGNATLIQENSREAWSFASLESFLQDLRYALRIMRRTPGLSAIVVLSLALAIGANTAIFSVIDALMLRMLPVANPERLVRIVNPNAPDFGFSYEQYERFRALIEPFAGVSAIYPSDRSNVVVNGPGGGVEPEPLQVGLASADYFGTLGVTAAIGRAFTPADGSDAGQRAVVVISHGYWNRRFGLAHDVLGRTIALNNTAYTIIGVAAHRFSGDWIGKPADLWIPLAMQSDVVLERPDHAAPWLRILARVRPGVSTQQAHAAAQAVYLKTVREMRNLRPRVRESMLHGRVEIEPAGKGFSPQRRAFAQSFAILMTGAGLVLLIACANIANLLLARSVARRREMGIRLALGGGAFRIARQLLTESLLLASIGGALGLVLAFWATRALAKFAASGLMPFSLDLYPDARILMFAAALSLDAGLLFGIAPACRVTSIPVIAPLQAWGNSAGRFLAGKLLVVVQVALSLAVLIAAGLFVRTLHNLKSQDLGFDREHVLLIWTSPEQAGRRGRAVAPLFESIPHRIATLPGVISASASVIGPLEGAYSDAAASPNMIAPGFFETAGMRVLLGRDFNDHDTETSPAVGIVNQTRRPQPQSQRIIEKHRRRWASSTRRSPGICSAKRTRLENISRSEKPMWRSSAWSPIRSSTPCATGTAACSTSPTGRTWRICSSCAQWFEPRSIHRR